MSILIIEDDEKVQSFLKESLEPEFSPVFAFSTIPFESQVIKLNPTPHTIILDRLIGSLDSIAIVPSLKRWLPQSSVLVLSAINDPTERAKLLDAGADDYMGKPFSLIELKSRIRALQRRTKPSSQTNYIKLNLTILDIQQRTISLAESKSSLSAKEYELFVIFAKNVGRVFSKFELMDKVWQSNLEIESNVLEVTVMNLRKKLSELGSDVQICSKRNLGYWLET